MSEIILDNTLNNSLINNLINNDTNDNNKSIQTKSELKANEYVFQVLDWFNRVADKSKIQKVIDSNSFRSILYGEMYDLTINNKLFSEFFIFSIRYNFSCNDPAEGDELYDVNFNLKFYIFIDQKCFEYTLTEYIGEIYQIDNEKTINRYS